MGDDFNGSEIMGCRVMDPSVPKNQTAGKFGSLKGNCDLPLITVDSALQYIAKFSPKIDFLLFDIFCITFD